MTTIEEKNKIENEFKKKYPSDNLNAWHQWHNDIPKIVKDKNYKVGVEIGVAYGGHSESILKNSNVEKLYGIDPYVNYDEYKGDVRNFNQIKQDDLHEMVKNRLSFYNERFELIRDFSSNCYDKFEDESLDFVYIDGNHFEKYIKEDVDNWWPKIKKGGMLSGHDYNHPSFPHITKYVNSFFKELNLKINVMTDHNWWVYKPE